MKRPNEVVICGKRYTINYVDDRMKLDPAKRRSYWGLIQYEKRIITVFVGKDEDQNKMQPADVLQILLHEIVHGVIEDTGFLKRQIKDDEALEIVCDQLANGLTDTLMRNGWLSLDDETDDEQ